MHNLCQPVSGLQNEKNTKTVNRSKIWLADGLVDASNLELIQGMAQGWEMVSDAISVTEADTNELIYVNPSLEQSVWLFG